MPCWGTWKNRVDSQSLVHVFLSILSFEYFFDFTKTEQPRSLRFPGLANISETLCSTCTTLLFRQIFLQKPFTGFLRYSASAFFKQNKLKSENIRANLPNQIPTSNCHAPQKYYNKAENILEIRVSIK